MASIPPEPLTYTFMALLVLAILISLLASARALTQYIDDTNLTAWTFDSDDWGHETDWVTRQADNAYNGTYRVGFQPSGHLTVNATSVKIYGVTAFGNSTTCNFQFGALHDPVTVGVPGNPKPENPGFNYLLFQADGLDPTLTTTIRFYAISWMAIDYAIIDYDLSTVNGGSVSPTSSSQSSNSPLRSSSPSTAVIIGGTVGGAIALGLVALVLWLVRRRNVMHNNQAQQAKQGISAFPLKNQKFDDVESPSTSSPSTYSIQHQQEADGSTNDAPPLPNSEATQSGQSPNLSVHERLARLEEEIREIRSRGVLPPPQY
ncbi:hypothetical protein DL96DRAFT_1623595 [Flagelloscypha sp. PMI_526]|nr:hypothetical protein DL96DRAFT_1623595 [Flagelloscypha sp. PMI_526]